MSDCPSHGYKSYKVTSDDAKYDPDNLKSPELQILERVSRKFGVPKAAIRAANQQRFNVPGGLRDGNELCIPDMQLWQDWDVIQDHPNAENLVFDPYMRRYSDEEGNYLSPNEIIVEIQQQSLILDTPPPEPKPFEPTYSYAYAVENPNEYLLKVFGGEAFGQNEFKDNISEDQRNDDGTITKEALIQEFIGTLQIYEERQKQIEIASITAQHNGWHFLNIPDRTLFDLVKNNHELLADILIEENTLTDVQAWLSGEVDISAWDVERILNMQHGLVPLYQHPDFRGYGDADFLGIDSNDPAYHAIAMFNMFSSVMNGEPLPFDPNQATRETYEAYLRTGRANLNVYYDGDLENPNYEDLANAHRVTLMEKNYIMMTYHDGFAEMGYTPTFDEFQAMFIDTSTEDLSTLGMELSVHTLLKQAEEFSTGNIQMLDIHSGMSDEEISLYGDLSLSEWLTLQGVNEHGLEPNDMSIVSSAAYNAVELGAAYFGGTALDESRQAISEGWADEHRGLLNDLKGEIGKMPSGSIFGKPVGQVRRLFSNYHDAKTAELDEMLNTVLNYEVGRFDQHQQDEDLNQIPFGAQLGLSIISDIADVELILREWEITGELPAFDALMTLLPVLNYGAGKALGKASDLLNVASDVLRNSDNVVDVAKHVDDVPTIMNRFDRVTGAYNSVKGVASAMVDDVKAVGRWVDGKFHYSGYDTGLHPAYAGGYGDNILYMSDDFGDELTNNPYNRRRQLGFEEVVGDWPISRTGTPKHGTQAGPGRGGVNATRLGENLEKSGISRPHTPEGDAYHAHHVIPSTAPEAYDLRIALAKKWDIDINSADNGIFLPPSVHHKIHGNNQAYVDWLKPQLAEVTNAEEAVAVLKNIAIKLENGAYPPVIRGE